MAFIDKKDPIVLNIKLTSKGRELLSKGQLDFTYYAVGDSEIDYEINRKIKEINPNIEPAAFNLNVLRPKDKNPKQLSFIPKNLDGDPYNEISTVPSTDSHVINQVQPLGFFNDDATEFLTDTDRVKQPDIAIAVSGVTGGTYLNLIQSPTYQANVNEPEIGDYLLIKWSNPLGISTTGYTVNKSYPTPFLWYKIQGIISGSLDGNNLKVKVDRELPDFSNITGGSNSVLAGALAYYNYIDFTGATNFSTDYVDEAVLAFLQNSQSPTITYPFWNMSIVYTEEIAGVNTETGDKSYLNFNTSGYTGFLLYIQNQQKYNENYDYKRKLGIIHYTNNTVSNTYGESFYGDPLNPQEATDIPTLDIPTVMWHKSTGSTLGLQLKATGPLKYLTGATKSLNTRYYDLVPSDIGVNYGPEDVVGKVFYDLEMFVIEDQELLFAMSYKSNRSWTLPEHNVDINANVTFGCPACLLDFETGSTSPSTIGGSDGIITINNIINSSLDEPDTSLILEIHEGPTGTTNPTKIYFNEITGDTTITSNDTLNNFKLSAGTYTVKLIDTGFNNCYKIKEISIPAISSNIMIYEEKVTSSKLNPYFNITPINNNPVHIRFYDSNANSIGFPFGTAYVTVGPTGMTNNNLENRYNNGEGTTGNEALGGTKDAGKWVAIPDGSSIDLTNLGFTEPYQIFVRDATGNTFSDIINSNVVDSQIWTYYVAASSPFVDPPNINITQGNDTGGDYVVISNYIDSPLDPNKNPIIGDIEISIYEAGGLPTEWESTLNDGSSVKIYINDMTTGTYYVDIRERYGYISMYKVTASDSVIIS